MRVVDGQTGALDGSWKIYVETGIADYATIASIVKSGIKATTGYDLAIAALSTRTDADHQIVIGDVSSDSISAIAARYQRNAVDLGDEGYNLISLPNSGKWLVLIAANSATGARHGAYTLLDLMETGSGTLKNIRIRDYPDSPHREVQHWLPTIPESAPSDWLASRKAELDLMAAWGANVVAFGRADFVRMDQSLGSNGTYGDWLKQLTDHAYSRGVPGVYGLSLNYPNPFNPATTIAYQVPAPGGAVSIRVYNVRGQLIATLVSRNVAPGFHTVKWEGVDGRGNGVASGVYFVRMLAPGFEQTRKAVVLK